MTQTEETSTHLPEKLGEIRKILLREDVGMFGISRPELFTFHFQTSKEISESGRKEIEALMPNFSVLWSLFPTGSNTQPSIPKSLLVANEKLEKAFKQFHSAQQKIAKDGVGININEIRSMLENGLGLMAQGMVEVQTRTELLS